MNPTIDPPPKGHVPERHIAARPINVILALAGFAFLPPLVSGCARVQPWDRDLLADPRMQMAADGVDQGLDEHIYFSKEASSGGRGFGGGGCGCN